MKDFLAGIGGLIFAGVLFVGIIVGGVYGYIHLYRDAAPRMQEAEREVFMETPSYVNGKTEQLSKMKREYETSKDAVSRKAIREEALNSAATINREKLPPAIRAWLTQLESN